MKKFLKYFAETLQDFTTLSAITALTIFILFGVGPLFT